MALPTFLGLEVHPLDDVLHNIVSKSAEEALADDHNAIAGDVKKAFDQETNAC